MNHNESRLRFRGSELGVSELNRQVTLLETLDRLLNRGVVIAGDLTLSVADVDLIHLGLRVLLSSVETAERSRMKGDGAAPEARYPPGQVEESLKRSGKVPPGESRPENLREEMDRMVNPLPGRINADPERVEQGLAKLVLTVIELLRRLLEKQALRRIEGGSLTPDEIERMGLTFLRLEEKMAELKAHFGLTDEDLNLSLGPLGDLM